MMFAAIVFGGLISLAVVVWQVLRAYFDTQTFIRDKLLGVLAESNQIISRCGDAMRESTLAMSHFVAAITQAPCGKNLTEKPDDNAAKDR